MAPIAVGVSDGCVWIIDVYIGTFYTAVTNMNWPSSICHPNDSLMQHISLLPDGRRGISSSEYSVLVWTVNTDTRHGHEHDYYNHLRLLLQLVVLHLRGLVNSNVRCVELSTEGKLAVVSCHDICVRVRTIDIDGSYFEEL